jgi:hypothetical protein
VSTAVLELLAWLGLLACVALLLWPLLPATRRDALPAAVRRAGRAWSGRWRQRRGRAEARRATDAAIRRAQRSARGGAHAAPPEATKGSREAH